MHTFASSSTMVLADGVKLYFWSKQSQLNAVYLWLYKLESQSALYESKRATIYRQ